METLNFTNIDPTKSFKVTNISKVNFGNCFFKKGREYALQLPLKIEFKTPTGHNDANGKPQYRTSSEPLNIGTKVNSMDKPNSPVIAVNAFVEALDSCTIVDISVDNASNHIFDFDIQYSIQS